MEKVHNKTSYIRGKQRGIETAATHFKANSVPNRKYVTVFTHERIVGDYLYSKEASKRKDRPKNYRLFHKGKSTYLGSYIRNNKVLRDIYTKNKK